MFLSINLFQCVTFFCLLLFSLHTIAITMYCVHEWCSFILYGVEFAEKNEKYINYSFKYFYLFLITIPPSFEVKKDVNRQRNNTQTRSVSLQRVICIMKHKTQQLKRSHPVTQGSEMVTKSHILSQRVRFGSKGSEKVFLSKINNQFLIFFLWCFLWCFYEVFFLIFYKNIIIII